MHVETYPESQVPPSLRRQALELQEQAWPSEGEPTVGLTHDPELQPESLLLIEDGAVVAALDILTKVLVHNDRAYVASGLSTVVTDQARRGQGHGRDLVLAAHAHIRNSAADLSIFTCDRPLQTFYERTGWRSLAGSVLVGGTRERPFPSDQFDKVVMVDFFSDSARSDASSFENARIELFPGTIDRLW